MTRVLWQRQWQINDLTQEARRWRRNDNTDRGGKTGWTVLTGWGSRGEDGRRTAKMCMCVCLYPKPSISNSLVYWACFWILVHPKTHFCFFSNRAFCIFVSILSWKETNPLWPLVLMLFSRRVLTDRHSSGEIQVSIGRECVGLVQSLLFWWVKTNQGEKHKPETINQCANKYEWPECCESIKVYSRTLTAWWSFSFLRKHTKWTLKGWGRNEKKQSVLVVGVMLKFFKNSRRLIGW